MSFESRWIYLGLNINSYDEMFGIGLFNFYFGIYHAPHGVEFAWGKVDKNGCL